MTTALLLMAHGSRRDEANQDLFHVAAALRARGPYAIVECSFLELAQPGIEEAATRCVALGAGRVILLPYFLSAGVHVQRDLSDVHQRLAERFPHVQFYLAEPLGRHPLLLDVVGARAREAEMGPSPQRHKEHKEENSG